MLRMLVVLVAVGLLPACTSAHDITVEAESYTTFYDVGGDPLTRTYCSAASGGEAVEGFDWVGEWIEVTLSTPEVGAYADTLRSAGLYGIQSDVRIIIYGAGQGGETLVSYYTPVGLGIG